MQKHETPFKATISFNTQTTILFIRFLLCPFYCTATGTTSATIETSTAKTVTTETTTATKALAATTGYFFPLPEP